MHKQFDFSYKSHIQGLRAIAIILIFFYHLNLEIFQKGYLGADIFFVISGYVITQKLFKDYILKKKININLFLISRIKRIYPTLTFVILVTLIFYVFFGPLDLIVSKFSEAIFTMFGLSNVYFLHAKKDFFDSVFLSPFSHTWSLGVEEQFYLFFPFLFYLSFKFLKIKNKTNIKFLIVSICLTLLVFTLFFLEQNFHAKYYYLQYYTFKYFPILPFWEIAFGSILFLFSKGKSKDNNLIFILSIILLILILFIDINIPAYINNILVAFLSCLVILFFNGQIFLRYIINNVILNYIGLISYSLYLWHLPVIYFSTLYFGNIKSVLISIFLSLLLSIFSYHYIENKFRYFTMKISSKLFLVYGFVIAIILVIFSQIIYSPSYESSVKKELKLFINKINYLEKKLNYSERTIFYKIDINGNEVYRYCLKNSKIFTINKFNLRNECLKNHYTKQLFYLEGNSGIAHFIPMLNASRFVNNLYYIHRNNIKDNNIEDLNQLIKDFKNIIYVLSVENLKELNEVRNIINKINPNIKILLFGPIPNAKNSYKAIMCFIRQIQCYSKKIDDFNRRNLHKLNSSLINLSQNNNKIYIFQPYSFLCPNNNCVIYQKKNDFLYYRDNQHLTREGSKILLKPFNQFLLNSKNSNLIN